MNIIKLGSIIATGVIAAAAVVLAVTNPKRDAYSIYAADRLNEQLEASLCEQVPVFLDSLCASVLSDQESWLQETIEAQTTRRNFLLFSIYETDLEAEAALQRILPANLSLDIDGLPIYHVESVGLLNQFFTYQVKKVEA
ncbi:MAG: DUF4359 domain-containing protein, partial [Elainellaceae cyanobacterium]